MSRAELDRGLRAADAAHRQELPRWRSALERAFSGEQRLTSDQRAALLGVPSRRQVLRVGGLAIAGSAVLAACSGDDGGDDADATTTSTTAPEEEDATGPELDLVLANTAISLELLAIHAYGTAIETGLGSSASFIAAAEMFQAHHDEHRAVLASIVEAAGGEPYAAPNAVVRAAIVDPTFYGATGETDVVRLLHDVELAAAQTYVHAATVMSTAELRSTAITIGGVESRHAAVLDALGELSNAKPAAYPPENPLPTDALITE